MKLGKRKEKERSASNTEDNECKTKMKKRGRRIIKSKIKESREEGMDANNPVRVFADGVFDLFHFGHAKVLEQAKKLFKYTYLVVGISSDIDTLREKGKQVMNQEERAESVRHCKWVDEVICPCPWITTPQFLQKHNIKYAAHDAIPYSSVSGSSDVYAPLKVAGMFKETQRTEGISTSDLILRILKDYDDYLWRSLQRGYTAKDMNISRFRATTLKLKHTVQNTVQELSKKIRGKVSIRKRSNSKKSIDFTETDNAKEKQNLRVISSPDEDIKEEEKVEEMDSITDFVNYIYKYDYNLV